MTFNKCSVGGKSYGEIFDSRGEPIEIKEVGLSSCIVISHFVVFFLFLLQQTNL